MSNTELWAEVRRLSEELETLKAKREFLTNHLIEMRALARNLDDAHAKTTAMAAELEEELLKRGNSE